MEMLDLVFDEGIVLQKEGIRHDGKPADLYLTNKNIICVEREAGLFKEKRSVRKRSLDDVKIAAGDIQVLAVKAGEGWVLQVLFTDGAERYEFCDGGVLAFSGGKGEAEKWARRMRDLLLRRSDSLAVVDAGSGVDSKMKLAAEMPKTAVGAVRGFGSQVFGAASDGVRSVSDALQKSRQEKELARFDPVSSERFSAQGFRCPSMIVVEDESALLRFGANDGAGLHEDLVGWISTEGGVEVFHLLQSRVAFSGLNFSPLAACDAIYCFDALGNRFIDVSRYYEFVQKEKMTELRDVAYCLGAKECRVESHEGESSQSLVSLRGDAKVKARLKAGASGESVSSEKGSHACSIVFDQKFEGSDDPVKPTLLWYKESKELNSLVDMRCSGNNSVKEYSISLDSTVSSSISTKRAAKIDAAMKGLGVKAGFSFEKKTAMEMRKKLVFYIRF